MKVAQDIVRCVFTNLHPENGENNQPLNRSIGWSTTNFLFENKPGRPKAKRTITTKRKANVRGIVPVFQHDSSLQDVSPVNSNALNKDDMEFGGSELFLEDDVTDDQYYSDNNNTASPDDILPEDVEEECDLLQYPIQRLKQTASSYGITGLIKKAHIAKALFDCWTENNLTRLVEEMTPTITRVRRQPPSPASDKERSPPLKMSLHRQMKQIEAQAAEDTVSNKSTTQVRRRRKQFR
ncbi:hypothetical protein AKO1_002874, partial [Acrasis kona]